VGWIAAVGARGQTITQPPPPGGGEIYGPTQGRDWVVANAKPLAVTDPGGGVTFTTLADLQTKINANPAGTKFVHAAGGTMTWDQAVSLGGKAPKIYFLGLAGSTATVINGGAANIIGITGQQTGAPAEIHGGRWTNFGSSSGQAFHGPMILKDGWLLEDFVVDGNFNAGFENQGSNVTIRRGRSSSNGQNAWRTNEYTSNGPKRTDNLYEHIETFSNNTRSLNPGDFAGGVKMLQVARNIGRYIYSHDEPGFALWYDNAEGGTLHTGNGFEECVVENSSRCALFDEGSGSGSFFRRNYLKDCGRAVTIGGQVGSYLNCAAIRIDSADQTLGGTTRGDVSRNVIDYTLSQSGNIGGLIVLFNNEGHPDRCKNWDIHHNQLWLRSASAQSNGRITGLDDATTGTMLVNGNVDFFDNEYHVASTSVNYWQWFTAGTRNEVTMSYSTWQGHHPGDDIPRVLI
jgi:hypothetical protein